MSPKKDADDTAAKAETIDDGRKPLPMLTDVVDQTEGKSQAELSPPTPPTPPAPDPHGAMAATAANPVPHPEDQPFPDVDQPNANALIERERWEHPAELVKEIRRHVKQSHGLEPDKQLLREIADFLVRSAHLSEDDLAS